MGLTIVTPASGSPIEDAEVKALCGIEDSAQDALLAILKPAAVRQVESCIGMALAATVYRLTLDAFSDAIELPRGPVSDVASVTYRDADGVSQVLNDSVYTLDLSSSPQWVVRNEGESWPDPLGAVNTVSVTFTAGYGSGTGEVPLPDDLKLAVGALVQHWFENGAAAGVPQGVWDLLGPYRRFLI